MNIYAYYNSGYTVKRSEHAEYHHGYDHGHGHNSDKMNMATMMYLTMIITLDVIMVTRITVIKILYIRRFVLL